MDVRYFLCFVFSLPSAVQAMSVAKHESFKKSLNQLTTGQLHMLGSGILTAEYQKKPSKKQKKKQAYKERLQRALLMLECGSERGNWSCQYDLGRVYDVGYLVEKDTKRAQDYYERSKDYPKSRYQLGIKCYQQKKYDEAFKHFTHAATVRTSPFYFFDAKKRAYCVKMLEHLDMPSLGMLASMYADGLGCEKDMDKALEYARRVLHSSLSSDPRESASLIKTADAFVASAERYEDLDTWSDAVVELITCKRANEFTYLRAINLFACQLYQSADEYPVEKIRSIVQTDAYRHMDMLASNNFKPAMRVLGQVHLSAFFNKTTILFDTAEIEEEGLLGADLLTRGFDGDEQDKHALGFAWTSLAGLRLRSDDIQRYVQFLSRAVEFGYLDAQRKYGLCHIQGFCIQKRTPAARRNALKTGIELLKQAGRAGDERALFELAKLYDCGDQILGCGEVVKRDPQEALKYLHAAVKHKSPDACRYLADKYVNGLDVKKNTKKADEYYKMAIDLYQQPPYSTLDDAKNDLAHLFFERGQYDKAHQLYQEMLPADSTAVLCSHALAQLTGTGMQQDVKQAGINLIKALHPIESAFDLENYDPLPLALTHSMVTINQQRTKLKAAGTPTTEIDLFAKLIDAVLKKRRIKTKLTIE